jgi:hypothetical protein
MKQLKILSFVLAIVIFSISQIAYAMTFQSVSKSPLYFNGYGKNPSPKTIVVDNGQKAQFVFHSGIFSLMDKHGKVALTFTSPDGGKLLEFGVYEIVTTNPDKHFWTVSAINGRGVTSYFWLIGQTKDGKFVKFFTPQSFPNLGDQHIEKITPNGNTLTLIRKQEVWPKGAQHGYQRMYPIDFQAELFWDEKADWFGINRII